MIVILRRKEKYPMKKIITAALTTVILILSAAIAHADREIAVRMDGVTSDNDSYYVQFDDIKPMQIDDRMLVPARAMAEAAGIEVVWDQPTQTAILLLKIGLYSEKPIERYAAKAISMVNPPTPGLEPVDITAAIKLGSSTAVIRYNFRDSEGDYISIGCEYEMVSKSVLVNGGTLMMPIRDSMEIFGLSVGWNQDELYAYVYVPETVTIPDNMNIIQPNGVGKYAPTGEIPEEYTNYSYVAPTNDNGGYDFNEEPSTDYISYSYEDYVSGNGQSTVDSSIGTYLGNFKITHYCPCNICNGGWGNGTAWAGEIVPGQTVGVNPDIIAPLSWVYIEGYGMRRAEDTGGGIGTYHIDVAVEDHDDLKHLSTVYRDVYLIE